MNKLFHVLNIVFFTIGITLFIFGTPVVVRADSFQPVVNPGTSSISCQLIKVQDPSNIYEVLPLTTGSPYSFYQHQITNGNRVECDLFSFNIDTPPTITPNKNYQLYNYQYYYQGVNHTIYYYVGGNAAYYITSGQYEDNVVISAEGTRVFNVNTADRQDIQRAINYFLFGVGSLDYELGQVDVEDPDLDIVGLSCYIMNDQTGSIDYKESIRNSFYGFTQYIFNNLSGGIFSDSFLPPILDESPLTGSIVNYVPGIALSWISPPLDSDIIYTVWIDGKSIVNYKTSADPIVNFVSDLKPATSVSYAKLKINESSLSQSGNSFYQYNTNQGFDTILNYIENNSSISPPSTPWQRYSYIGLDTKISRVYIQASKVIDGNNHIGALSYVDIIDGIPSVHEGVTSIDDVTASDPDTGTGNNVGVPYTVSGDTIYTGDTINNGDTYNIYGGSGLVFGGGNPLNTVKTLFNAIIRLVEALYLTHLIKWILVGFTGNPLGDFIL